VAVGSQVRPTAARSVHRGQVLRSAHRQQEASPESGSQWAKALPELESQSVHPEWE